MEKIKVAIIFGGQSPEHDVSLVSAHAVLSNLDRTRYAAIPLGVTRAGEWFRYDGDIARIRDGSWQQDTGNLTRAALCPDRSIHGLVLLTPQGGQQQRIDVVFPVMHGKNGEDGTVQGLIELSGIPYVGCGVLASALSMDKARAHQLALQAGVRVPSAVVLEHPAQLPDCLADIRALGWPVFVKPVRAGSSFGITRVTGEDTLEQAVCLAFEFDAQVIVEQAVEGFEVGCAVLGNQSLFMGIVDEIELAGGFFDYNEKYNLESAKIHLPARISDEMAQRVKDCAATVYAALDCKGFARVDFFVTPTGEIVFNEVNTIPGFTPHSRYPNMMQAAGVSYPALLDRLIELGMAR